MRNVRRGDKIVIRTSFNNLEDISAVVFVIMGRVEVMLKKKKNSPTRIPAINAIQVVKNITEMYPLGVN